MAVLRLTAPALAVAVAACSAAGAEPAPAAGPPAAAVAPAGPAATAAHPAGWRQLPAVASAVAAAARTDGVAVDATDAWGEPARGCYAVWLALRGGSAGAAALADQVLGSVAGLSPTEVVRPIGPDGTLAFGFARPPYRGRVRAKVGAGRISAVACFANQREPVACDAACRGVLEGAP
ncbi:MAG TPA: hypothetical protein VK607_21275 [Kofleriaceae bacterium]|nr:hypothetical protein [Kofleriaceae bacterium]HMG52482.1 hypothetical protein [Kofleriaceae bacterium]